MTQIDADYQQDKQTILRDVLRMIATTPNPLKCFGPMLEASRALTGAQGAALLIFEEPYIRRIANLQENHLPEDAVLWQLANELPHGIHQNPALPNGNKPPYDHWLLAQIQIQQNPVAVLWLALDQPLGEEHDLLFPLVDGLTIVTRNVRTLARQEMLSRNQSEFMRIVSHDLRSPLTSMQGFGSMLESGMVGDMNDKQMHFVEKILSGIEQMTSLVENIQDAGRYDPETGFYEMERSQCDLIDMVERIVENHLVPAEKQELTIQSNIAPDVPIVYVDQTMLERAITNLVDNAIKYTPNGGTIEVGLNRDEHMLVISVHDSGLGISPDNQKMLFERHVRIPRAEHKRVKGSGLGLFIVRSVAQRHGGNAWVESTEGDGSTFFISLPLDEANTSLVDENDES